MILSYPILILFMLLVQQYILQLIILLMIDQIRQAAQNFEGIYKQYNISLRLTPEDHLELRMKNQQTLDYYYLLVDHEYIKNEKDFSNILEEPIEILECFLHHFNNVTVQNDTINLRYEFGGIRRKVKNLTFKTELLPQDLSIQAVQIMKENFRIELSFKNKNISQLQDKLKMEETRFNEILEKTKEELFKRLSQKEEERLQSQNQRKESQMLNAKMQQMVNENERLKDRVNAATKEAINLRQQLQEAIEYKRLYEMVDSERNAIFQFEEDQGLITWKKIGTLKYDTGGVNIIGKILSITKSGRKMKVVIGDETGTVLAYLKQDELLVVGNTIVLYGTSASLFRKRIQLKNCEIEAINYEVTAVNTSNNISASKWE